MEQANIADRKHRVQALENYNIQPFVFGNRCLNPCIHVAAAANAWYGSRGLYWLIVCSCVCAWLARMLSGVKLTTADQIRAMHHTTTATGGTDDISIDSAPVLPPPAIVGVWAQTVSGQTWRHILQHHQWMITRVMLLLWYYHLYGVVIFNRSLRVSLQWFMCAAMFALHLYHVSWILWWMDTPCNKFTVWLYTQASLTFAATTFIIVSALLSLRTPAPTVNLQQE